MLVPKEQGTGRDGLGGHWVLWGDILVKTDTTSPSTVAREQREMESGQQYGLEQDILFGVREFYLVISTTQLAGVVSDFVSADPLDLSPST
ncbi:unnamed protein product [Anisakis simplex]|uniref:Transposase n=1 Tax=Anisakis simplex TaxID=6269 RepID=A0A0M3J6H3_ANISI|nr:unnamed protein product [Anisakis simplex]